MFKTFISNLQKINRNNLSKIVKGDNTNNIKLGRFNTCKNPKEEEIKAVLNSSDHCGDLICGKPQIVKNIVVNHKMEVSVHDYPICCQLLGISSAKTCRDCPI